MTTTFEEFLRNPFLGDDERDHFPEFPDDIVGYVSPAVSPSSTASGYGAYSPCWTPGVDPSGHVMARTPATGSRSSYRQYHPQQYGSGGRSRSSARSRSGVPSSARSFLEPPSMIGLAPDGTSVLGPGASPIPGWGFSPASSDIGSLASPHFVGLASPNLYPHPHAHPHAHRHHSRASSHVHSHAHLSPFSSPYLPPSSSQQHLSSQHLATPMSPANVRMDWSIDALATLYPVDIDVDAHVDPYAELELELGVPDNTAAADDGSASCAHPGARAATADGCCGPELELRRSQWEAFVASDTARCDAFFRNSQMTRTPERVIALESQAPSLLAALTTREDEAGSPPMRHPIHSSSFRHHEVSVPDGASLVFEVPSSPVTAAPLISPMARPSVAPPSVSPVAPNVSPLRAFPSPLGGVSGIASPFGHLSHLSNISALSPVVSTSGMMTPPSPSAPAMSPIHPSGSSLSPSPVLRHSESPLVLDDESIRSTKRSLLSELDESDSPSRGSSPTFASGESGLTSESSVTSSAVFEYSSAGSSYLGALAAVPGSGSGAGSGPGTVKLSDSIAALHARIQSVKASMKSFDTTADKLTALKARINTSTSSRTGRLSRSRSRSRSQTASPFLAPLPGGATAGKPTGAKASRTSAEPAFHVVLPRIRRRTSRTHPHPHPHPRAAPAPPAAVF